MDDLELEARLRTRLHTRFDDATPSPDLASNVSQALTTQPRRVGFALRMRPISLGWAAVAVAVVLVVGAIGIGNVFGPTGPGVAATPTPISTTASERWFVVLPPAGTDLNKPVASLADSVLSARIRALGIGNFTSGGGYGIEFLLPDASPSDASIRAVLGATGDARIVPLPTTDYGVGKLSATLGQPLPKDEPALIGWDGIASVASDPLAGAPDLTITLKPAAAQAFGDYTTSHLGETFAIVLDGRVVLLPTVTEPITSSQLVITRTPDDAFAEMAAILVGGELPEGWRGASVPVLISQEDAAAAALAATHSEAIEDEGGPNVGDLGPLGALRVWWDVQVAAPTCAPPLPCPSAASLLVRVDAVTGEVFHIGNLEP